MKELPLAYLLPALTLTLSRRSGHEMSERPRGARPWCRGAREPPSMGETWDQGRGVPRVAHVRRIPMAVRAGETRRAAGAPALPALLPCTRAEAGTREAAAVEPGLGSRRRPRGLAARTRDVAPHGTGRRTTPPAV